MGCPLAARWTAEAIGEAHGWIRVTVNIIEDIPLYLTNRIAIPNTISSVEGLGSDHPMVPADVSEVDQ